MEDTTALAIDKLSHLKGIIIEGNSAIEFSKPDIIVFIVGRDDIAMKKNAVKIINKADIVLIPDGTVIKTRKTAQKIIFDPLSLTGLDEFIEHIDKKLR
jgi:hypothetical protein